MKIVNNQQPSFTEEATSIAASPFLKIRKPKPGDIITKYSDSSSTFTVEEILISNISSDMSDKYDFFNSGEGTALCRIESGEYYSYLDLEEPVFRHIVELNALITGIELDDEEVDRVTRSLTTHTLLRCPKIDKDDLEDIMEGGIR